uniref:Reverse transcriptase zinc-binding domain-containing protein n=1 Tax=Cannabis sativa TaxID=3483 RepID=A0A803R596_CANSA
MMQVQEAGADSMYLGLPSTVGRNKNAVLGFLKEKMKKRISSWEGKFLSRAGKEVLIKSVVQSLPSYAMNVFLFPIGTCNELERMMASFWWKSKRANNNGSGIVWMNWDKMTRSKTAGGMGFRNLRDFNLAMLGKQGWRLLFRHDSLVSKVFKARYYPQGDYLSAELGSNPSFIWSSIFAAKDTVKLGLRKGIGSGLIVQITTDPWLPSLDNNSNSQCPGLENFTVNSLFQTHSRPRMSMLLMIFYSDDAALILGIQIKQAVEDDFWYWFAERNGLYSVRSAYQLIQDHKQPPIPTEDHRFWNKLWSLKVPPKTKDLVWRAASNCLATKVNLCIKKVLTDNKCPLCGVFAETELHLLVSCQFAWACWEFSGFNAADRNPVSLLSWLSFNAARMDDEKLSRVVMLCWAIWSARNDFLWKNRVRSVKSVVDFAQSSLHQFLKAQGVVTYLHCRLQTSVMARGPTKPTVGIKLNVDAALFEQDLKHGFGCVIRNTEGELISVLAGAKQGKVAPEIAEALGIREALSWLKNHNYSHAVVESDSLVCVDAIRSNVKLNSGFGYIVEECKLILRSLLNVTLCFVKRSANRAAHFIARHSLSLAERMFPINSVPLELLSILLGNSSY